MKTPDAIRILLVDDHLVVRKGLIHVLSDCADIDIVGEAESGEEALFLCTKLKPDIVIMDVKMDGVGGAEATRLLIQHHSSVYVIGLSSFADRATIAAMLDAGARAYLSKDVSAKDLIDTIYRVRSGEILHAEGTDGPGSPDQRTAQNVILDQMGDQQRRVLALMIKGFTNPEIAKFMGFSVPTARYHVSAILQKLDVSTRSEAVAQAVLMQLLPNEMQSSQSPLS